MAIKTHDDRLTRRKTNVGAELSKEGEITMANISVLKTENKQFTTLEDYCEMTGV